MKSHGIVLSEGAQRRAQMSPHFPVAVAWFLISLVGCRSEPYDVVVHDRLLKLAGENAIDCGRATTNDQNAQHSACALASLGQRKPFLVQYRTVGIDAISEQGFALDAKNQLSSVSTFSWGPSAPVGKIDVTGCDPQMFHESSTGYLVCY